MRTHAFVLTLLICISYIAAQTPGCTQCSTDLSACIIGAGAAPCPCYDKFASCIGQNQCSLLGSSCNAIKPVCPNVNCPALGPSGIPCLDCSSDFNSCYSGDTSKICNCAPTYDSCLATNKCGTSACNSFKPLCPSLQCAAPTGCAKCSFDYTNCVMASPTASCTCLDSLRKCTSTCGNINVNISDPFGATCLIYQQSCPDITCPPPSPCGKCIVDYVPCATNAIKTGDFTTGGVCTCLDTMLTCLVETKCIDNTPYTSLCPFYKPFCSNMKCSGRSDAAQQIAGLLDQYKQLVSDYLESIFNGTTINFGVSVSRGNSRVVPLTLTIPDNETIQDFIERLKVKLAEYFKVELKKLTIVVKDNNVKRSQAVNAEMQIEGAQSSGSTFSSGTVAMVIAVVVAVVSMI